MDSDKVIPKDPDLFIKEEKDQEYESIMRTPWQTEEHRIMVDNEDFFKCKEEKNDDARSVTVCNATHAKEKTNSITIHVAHVIPNTLDEESAICSIKSEYPHDKKMAPNDTVFACNFCEENFPKEETLSSHIKSHKKESSGSSEQHRYAFDSSELEQSTKKPNEEKIFKCEQCSKCFSRLYNLKMHIRIHSGDRPFICAQCGKCFSRSYSLTVHNKTHTGEKPYICEQCGQCFFSSPNLSAHRMTHSGEKPYKCEQCGKCFGRLSGLKLHNRIHTGEKPYKCKQCGQCFSRLFSLTTHNRTHTSDKPYKCKQCDKCFSRLYCLTVHNRTHTGEKPFKCELCGKCFSRSSRLASHLRTHPGENP